MTFYPSSLLSGHHHMFFDTGTNNHICKMNKMQTDKSCTFKTITQPTVVFCNILYAKPLCSAILLLQSVGTCAPQRLKKLKLDPES